MAPEKAPAFQFYPKDFLSDEKQAAMSAQECGVYIRLMCRCWLEGSIPDDVTQVARLGGVTTAQLRKFWPAIRRCFAAHETDAGRLVHGRLERERSKQDSFRRRQSDKGSKGAEKRWPRDGTGIATAMAQAIPKHSSSISDLRSPDSSRYVSEVPRDEDATRAATFIDRYAELYSQYRHGATWLRRKPVLEFQAALRLIGAFPDDRLEKLVKVFLKSDDDWIAGTDRGLLVFESKASWCDERLATWEAKQRPA